MVAELLVHDDDDDDDDVIIIINNNSIIIIIIIIIIPSKADSNKLFQRLNKLPRELCALSVCDMVTTWAYRPIIIKVFHFYTFSRLLLPAVENILTKNNSNNNNDN